MENQSSNIETEKVKTKRRRCRPIKNKSVCNLNEIVPDQECKEMQIRFEKKNFDFVMCESVKKDLEVEFQEFKLNWVPLVPVEDANQMVLMQKIRLQQLRLHLENQFDISLSDSSEEDEDVTWCIDPSRGGMAQMACEPKIPPFFYWEKEGEVVNDWTSEERLNW